MNRPEMIQLLIQFSADPNITVSKLIMSTPHRVGVNILFLDVCGGVCVCVGITQITKGTPAQIFSGLHVFCSPGHCLLISAMTLTFGLKVKF